MIEITEVEPDGVHLVYDMTLLGHLIFWLDSQSIKYTTKTNESFDGTSIRMTNEDGVRFRDFYDGYQAGIKAAKQLKT